MANEKKPWAGRFKEATAKSVERFTCSLHVDARLYRYDIEGSVAHATMLADAGIISRKDSAAIIRGLKSILKDMDQGEFVFDPADEDIHMAIEKELIRRVGQAGGKLHTARSRNDQIALDVRLYLRVEIDNIVRRLLDLRKQLVKLAKSEIRTIMPGYTHMQKAQPVLLSHYLLAFAEMFGRDEQRLSDCRCRLNVLPLGVAALAGTGLPIDRSRTAQLLNFPAVSQNSMDTVADRDYVAEFIFTAALCMTHLSRFCEDLILWSSDEFGFVQISDAYTTGSSIMPQKKNPDIPELIRGKSGRVVGNLMSLLMLLKGLPMTYNRDLQEDKEPLFDTVDTVSQSVAIMAQLLGNLTFNEARLAKGLGGGYMTATDLADYLVLKNIPFRQAHAIVGRTVAFCISKGKELTELTVQELQNFSEVIEADVFKVLSIEGSVASRVSLGGTSGKMVAKALKRAEKEMRITA